MLRQFWFQLLCLIVGTFCVLAVMMSIGPGESLDAKIYYTDYEARELFSEMSESERTAYTINEIIDFVLIALYTTALYLMMFRLFPDIPWIRGFAFLPGFFDFIETGVILISLLSGSKDVFLPELGMVTMVKWITGLAVFVGIISVFLGRAKRAQSLEY